MAIYKVHIKLSPFALNGDGYSKEFEAEFVPDGEDQKILREMIKKYIGD